MQSSNIWMYLFFVSTGFALFFGYSTYSSKSVGEQINNSFYNLDGNLQEFNQNMSESVKSHTDGVGKILSRSDKEEIVEVFDVLRDSIKLFVDEIERYKIRLTASCLIQNNAVIKDKERFEKIVAASTIEEINFEGEVLTRRNVDDEITISKDKDWTTFLMLKCGYGDQLEQYIRTSRQNFIQQYRNILTNHQKALRIKDESLIEDYVKGFEENFTLKLNENWKERSNKDTWAAAYFDHMPYAACMPILEKFKSDTRAGEATIVSNLVEMSTGHIQDDDIRNYFPIVMPKKNVLKKGEPFSAEITLGYIDRDMMSNSSTTVNGRRVITNEKGISTFKQTSNNTGMQELEIEIISKHILSGKMMKFKTVYEYVVVE